MLRLFGQVILDLDPTIARPPIKAFALLAMLALAPKGSLERATVATNLWDGDKASALGNLRVLLTGLKKYEAPDMRLLRWDARRIWRDATCLPSDVDAFLGLGEVEKAPQLKTIQSLYRGDLLEGAEIRGGEGFEAWLAHARAEIGARYRDLVLRAQAASDPAEARAALLRLSRQFPFDEQVERALLMRTAQSDGPAAVSHEFEEFSSRLMSELDVTPQLETRALVMQLLGKPVGAEAWRPIIDELPVPQSSLPRVLVLAPEENRPSAFNAALPPLIDDITIGLCKQRTFQVFAPHTARQLAKGFGSANLAAYGTDYVFAARILSSDGDAFRLGVSLTRLSTHQVLFGDDFRLSATSMSRGYSDIVAAIVRGVSGSIETSELKTFRRTGNASAYVHYLLGLEHLNTLDLPTVRKARKSFRRAAELDANFAPALAMMSRTLSLEWLLLGRQEADLLDQAWDFGEQAVAIDPLEPSGLRELGNVAVYRHDLDEGLDHLTAALNRAPHHADLLQNYADTLVHNSEAAKAKPFIRSALELNPLPPDEYYWIAATVEFFVDNYDEALQLLWKMKNPDPAARFVAAVAAKAGDAETARIYRNKLLQRQPEFRLDQWRKLMPLRNEADREKYLDAMRLAGFT
ncbi:hypothetical protein VW35_07745 [Devosia soli]|uniref:Bacterial transcriptional activator domain-containing protein n=1 Tax=Devosia soli TaxID=361041 RepID=A0A0F5LD23_9HYPH|nr:bacterial transcriptional activator domain-containing protein [Devosia soli]KKB80291.1 hypothetical protein VW35_07745 [Devosia soli]